jgi:hypothetical protein
MQGQIERRTTNHRERFRHRRGRCVGVQKTWDSERTSVSRDRGIALVASESRPALASQNDRKLWAIIGRDEICTQRGFSSMQPTAAIA